MVWYGIQRSDVRIAFKQLRTDISFNCKLKIAYLPYRVIKFSDEGNMGII